MVKSLLSNFGRIIEVCLFTYYVIPIGFTSYIVWLFFTGGIPNINDYQAVKDICSLIATIMASFLGLFFAIVVIAFSIKDKISLRSISFEGLLQICSLIFCSLLISSIEYIFISLTKHVNEYVIICIIGFFLIALFRLLDLIRTSVYCVLKELNKSNNL